LGWGDGGSAAESRHSASEPREPHGASEPRAAQCQRTASRTVPANRENRTVRNREPHSASEPRETARCSTKPREPHSASGPASRTVPAASREPHGAKPAQAPGSKDPPPPGFQHRGVWSKFNELRDDVLFGKPQLRGTGYSGHMRVFTGRVRVRVRARFAVYFWWYFQPRSSILDPFRNTRSGFRFLSQ
jgi:hypothetical protein